jgi:hypothetical protein
MDFLKFHAGQPLVNTYMACGAGHRPNWLTSVFWVATKQEGGVACGLFPLDIPFMDFSYDPT